MRLATVTYSPTIILTGVKSLSYGANMQATRIAQARGADEALLVRPDGIVLEAPTSTIFWVSPEGGLRTPAIGSGILESITRAHIIKALHVEEGEFGLDDLLGTHEAFLASTVREVQPVAAIDDFASRSPARRTNEAAEAFQASLRQRSPGRRLHRRGPRPDRRAAPDLGDGARLHRQRDHPAGPRQRPRRRASTSSSPAGSATWDISAPRSPRSTAAAASTT